MPSAEDLAEQKNKSSAKNPLMRQLEIWWEKWRRRGNKKAARDELLEILRESRLSFETIKSTLKAFVEGLGEQEEREKREKEGMTKLRGILVDAIIMMALEEKRRRTTEELLKLHKFVGVKEKTIQNHLTKLVQEGLIVRVERGVYMLAKFITPQIKHVQMLVEFVMKEMSMNSGVLHKGMWYDKLRMMELKEAYKAFIHETDEHGPKYEGYLCAPLFSARPEYPDQFEKKLIPDFSLHPEEDILDNDLLKILVKAVDGRIGWLYACIDELRERLDEARGRIYNVRYLTSGFGWLLRDLWLRYWSWPWEIVKTLFARGRMLWFLSRIFDEILWNCFLDHVRQTDKEAAEDFEGLSENVGAILSRLRLIIEGLIELLRSEGCEIPTIITKMAKHDRKKFSDLVKILDGVLRQMRDIAGGRAPGLIIDRGIIGGKEFFRVPLTDISTLIREDRRLAGRALVKITFSLLEEMTRIWIEIGVPIEWDEEIERIEPGTSLTFEDKRYVGADSEERPIYVSEVQGRRLKWVEVKFPNDISLELVRLLAETAFKHTDLGERLEELLQLMVDTLERLEEFKMRFERAREHVIHYMLAIEGGEVPLAGVCSLCGSGRERKAKNLE